MGRSPRRVLWLAALAALSCRKKDPEPTPPDPLPVPDKLWVTDPDPEPSEFEAGSPGGGPGLSATPMVGPFVQRDAAARAAVAAARGEGLPGADERDACVPEVPRDIRAMSSGADDVHLLAVGSDLACAPIEYCVLAVEGTGGWFATVQGGDHAHCQGVSGPDEVIATDRHTIERRDDVVVHRYDTRTRRVEYGTGLEREEHTVFEAIGLLRVCHVGEEPRCAEPVLVACPSFADASVLARGAWTLEEGVLIVREPARVLDPYFEPDEEHQAPEMVPACDSIQVSAGRHSLPW